MLSYKGLDNGNAVPPNANGDSQKHRLIVATSSEHSTESVSHLGSQMYDIERAFTSEQLLNLISKTHYHLIVIDKSSDDMDGTSLLRSLMSNDNQSLVVVVSETDDEIDKIVALELGADDCVHSSCGPRELKARVSALLRRCQKLALITNNRSASKQFVLGDELSHKNWILNRIRCQLYSPAGSSVYLTSAEFEILSVLFSEPGVVKDRLSLRNIAVNNDEYDARSLDVFVSRLRKKLSSYGGQDLIETVRGRGYRLSKSEA
jgi:DNA-binding response OmpR family regulator